MKTINLFLLTLIICFLSTMEAIVYAQPGADIEGDIYLRNTRPRIEFYDESASNRLEGWLEEFQNGMWLSSFYGDVVFAADTTGFEEERLRIKGNSGNVGIGIFDPISKLHVDGTVRTKDGSVIIHDGALTIVDANEVAHFSNVGGDLHITTPGAVSPYQLYISDDMGYIGINNNTPLKSLHVKQLSNTDGVLLENHASGNYWNLYVDGVDDFNFGYNDVLRAYIEDGAGSFVITSDGRLKNSIESIPTVLDKIMQLQPKQYFYNVDETADRKSWGFIAQEVERVFPELVLEKDGYKGLIYDDFAIMSIKAIQEQQRVIQEQQDVIDDQANRLTTLEKQVQLLLSK